MVAGEVLEILMLVRNSILESVSDSHSTDPAISFSVLRTIYSGESGVKSLISLPKCMVATFEESMMPEQIKAIPVKGDMLKVALVFINSYIELPFCCR